MTNFYFEKILKNDYVRNILELILTVTIFRLNSYAGLIVLAVLVVDLMATKNNANMLYAYIFLSFFDEVLIFEPFNGSISRIIMCIIFIKSIYFIIKRKLKPDKEHIGVLIFLALSFIVGLISNGFDISVFIVFANVITFVLFSMCIKKDDNFDIGKFIEKLAAVILVAVIISIVLGLILSNYAKEIENYETNKTIYRFSGTYEPNFMSMYINLGVLSAIIIKEKFNKIVYYVLISTLINFVILTVSITGMVSLAISLGVGMILLLKEKKTSLLDISAIIIGTIIIYLAINLTNVFKVEQKDPVLVENIEYQESIVVANLVTITNDISKPSKQVNSNLETLSSSNETSLAARFKNLKDLIVNGDLARVSSGRLPIAINFIKASFKRPLFNILFGVDANNHKIYCEFFDKDCYAHNAYLDFLYNHGIIGFCVVLIYFLRKTFRNIFLGYDLKTTKYCNNIKIIRIMLLIFALALTLNTKRMFLMFFLL